MTQAVSKQATPVHGARAGQRVIGLFGGSFNPPHAGHLHVSKEACKRLPLDELWWVVSPRNPLKKASELAPFEKRWQAVQEITEPYPRIKALDIEERLTLPNTFSSLSWLQTVNPAAKFIWLIGLDNWYSFHKWYRWRDILTRVPVVIFARGDDALRLNRAPAGIWAKNWRLFNPSMLRYTCKGWYFCAIPKNYLAATNIRASAPTWWQTSVPYLSPDF